MRSATGAVATAMDTDGGGALSSKPRKGGGLAKGGSSSGNSGEPCKVLPRTAP